MKRLYKFLALLLLLVLPLQGMAAAYAPLHNAQRMQSAADTPCHGENTQHDMASSTGSTHHQSGSDTSNAGHSCCHQVLSCVPSFEIRSAAQKFSDVPHTALLLHTLFVPDSPYRPPRG